MFSFHDLSSAIGLNLYAGVLYIISVPPEPLHSSNSDDVLFFIGQDCILSSKHSLSAFPLCCLPMSL